MAYTAYDPIYGQPCMDVKVNRKNKNVKGAFSVEKNIKTLKTFNKNHRLQNYSDQLNNY